MNLRTAIIIIGGGLAGCEAAWQLARRGVTVTIHEMKPSVFSPAHRSPLLAELVCSNSLRSSRIESAVGLLKEELRLAGSLIMEAAEATRVPAGTALAVDREKFSRYVELKLASSKNISLIRGEVTSVPRNSTVIIATGPLTSDILSQDIASITGSDYLYFYDAISPVIEAHSINLSKIFWASRYTAGIDGDYLNCPMTRQHYEHFLNELIHAREAPLHHFEDRKCFEGCLPVEVLARRGIDTLRYGPMKPVGLTVPWTGIRPHAVVQLRKENRTASLFNMVGFQTKLLWSEQKRIFRLIPGLENAEFARYGSIHRNTFINAPALLNDALQLKTHDTIYFAGQITGVEGYVESTAMGLLAGLSAASRIMGKSYEPPPDTSAVGALIKYITTSEVATFQPMNVTFGLFPPLAERVHRHKRGEQYAERAVNSFNEWLKNYI
ncbi:MAG: methylenetetrahydrofolate--tRNA-(uracil(54)-C(5))-methyltransferase (FADH(2)-oxidizing) TrmFO [Deltaproteobacteria bacterium]|nr:methylenetetrahydrofolate--tRNA-(uracil(54)-C(5))-methyltransferase (FADH(2)-oxidizing) TrmFO [Deltaproteobacteria bacterium]